MTEKPERLSLEERAQLSQSGGWFFAEALWHLRAVQRETAERCAEIADDGTEWDDIGPCNSIAESIRRVYKLEANDDR
jgi:hypothetical protein